MSQADKNPQSVENRDLIIKVGDQVAALAGDTKMFMEKQDRENARLHERIDDTQTRFQTAMEGLKDSWASRGRVTSAHIGTLISIITLLGFIGTTYVSMTVNPFKPAIEGVDRRLGQLEATLTEERIRTARELGKAEAERAELQRNQEQLKAAAEAQ